MGDVVEASFGGGPCPQYGVLAEKVLNVFLEFEGELPVTVVLGVLEIVKADIIRMQFDEAE